MDDETRGEPLFKSIKRRKIFRKRQGEDEEEDQSRVTAPTPSADSKAAQALIPASESEETPRVSAIIRARRLNKNRGHGIEFSSSTPRSVVENHGSISATATTESDADRLKGITERFLPYTGQVVDVDKHMVAYIESELAKRRPGGATSNSADGDNGCDGPTHSDAMGQQLPQRQPASLGKLQEIDLGQAATLRNLQRTEAALRRQKGEEIPPEDSNPIKKPRLGRNGKPRRGPKRRNSEDIKRDQLVEQVLRETRLDIYDDPAASEDQAPVGDEEADERLAEQFKQEFIDAMQSKQRNRNPAPSKGPGEASKGPKMGGSRSARAAMHKEQTDKAVKK